MDDQSDVVLAALAERRAAMLTGDTAALARLFDERLAYTHSSGLRDDKATLLGRLERGEIAYRTLEFFPDQVHIVAGAAVVIGRMEAEAVVGGTARTMNTAILEVWSLADDGCRLVGFQSTALPTG